MSDPTGKYAGVATQQLIDILNANRGDPDREIVNELRRRAAAGTDAAASAFMEGAGADLAHALGPEIPAGWDIEARRLTGLAGDVTPLADRYPGRATGAVNTLGTTPPVPGMSTPLAGRYGGANAFPDRRPGAGLEMTTPLGGRYGGANEFPDATTPAALAAAATEPGTAATDYSNTGGVGSWSANNAQDVLAGKNMQVNPAESATWMGGRPWMENAGIGAEQLALRDPLNYPQAYLGAYADQAGLPGYWAAQNAALYNTVGGMYAMGHPGQDPLNPAQLAGQAEEFGVGGQFGTPGQYVDTGAQWDALLGGGAAGPGLASGLEFDALQKLPPEQQASTLKGALRSLQPWMLPDAASAVEVMFDQAVDNWNQAQLTPGAQGYGMDLFTYMRDVEDADQWM